MDQSAPHHAQSTHTQVHAISRTQPPSAVVSPGGMTNKPNEAGQISGSKEHGPIHTGSRTEISPQEEQDAIMPSQQETAGKSGSSVKEEQSIEIKASVPEIAVEKSLEAVVEKSVDTEKPKITEELKKVGITHSGPGIPIETNKFSVTTMPMQYEEAKAMDKATSIRESKHWLAELVMYVWRKIDPMIEKKLKEEKK